MSDFTLQSETQNESGCIANNIPYKFFRLGVESKGLLTAKGGLYVGTGETRETTVVVKDSNNQDVTITCNIPVTEQLSPKSLSDGKTYILSCVNGVLEWIQYNNN